MSTKAGGRRRNRDMLLCELIYAIADCDVAHVSEMEPEAVESSIQLAKLLLAQLESGGDSE